MKCDSGQAAPLYAAAVAGLLFVALIFFTFGEADIRRNGAQGAADAAALAAAKESRSLLEPELEAHLTDPDYFESVFGTSFLGGPGNACGKASEFAALNDAADVRCRPLSDGRWGYEVSLRSSKGMSTDLVPGTKGKKASAEAVAVVEPRCTFAPAAEDDTVPDPETEPDPDTDADPDPVIVSIGKVSCDGGLNWVVDPEELELMPDIADLFTVRLAED
ncbi:pilus assembly protein TadG-related protein [Streptomyces sp. NBC_00525]|uniref:pilus assembly protein TadG-related protein n=1 Tax=Streptomyces sp. NBC_00525 TaxID=2903660 RepID=UPI002E8040DC|nr:pilus assembly protein TadG-related protein [Streptomyces sp. NBC_00525]WUC95674.1 pilus assembly protein TadG-related protein [Streptomyces sp. NBC_00525]